MKLFRRNKKEKPPVERRKPENAKLRSEFAKQQQAETQATLSAAQALTDETGRRIERLRRIAKIVHTQE